MKRIKCLCGSAAIAQSDIWPSIKLCHDCYKSFSEFMATKMPETLDGNPLAADLCGLDPHGDRYRIWITDDSFVSREYYFSNRRLTLDKSDQS